jgi:hypothetical protein
MHSDAQLCTLARRRLYSSALLGIGGNSVEFLIVWLVLALVVAAVADVRGRSAFGFFMLSVLLSPLIGLVVLLAGRNLAQEQRDEAKRQAQQQHELTLLRGHGAPTASRADELEKLISLKERGALTDEEFQAEKARLLSRQP